MTQSVIRGTHSKYYKKREMAPSKSYGGAWTVEVILINLLVDVGRCLEMEKEPEQPQDEAVVPPVWEARRQV